jgi:hypothetical protein
MDPRLILQQHRHERHLLEAAIDQHHRGLVEALASASAGRRPSLPPPQPPQQFPHRIGDTTMSFYNDKPGGGRGSADSAPVANNSGRVTTTASAAAAAAAAATTTGLTGGRLVPSVDSILDQHHRYRQFLAATSTSSHHPSMTTGGTSLLVTPLSGGPNVRGNNSILYDPMAQQQNQQQYHHHQQQLMLATLNGWNDGSGSGMTRRGGGDGNGNGGLEWEQQQQHHHQQQQQLLQQQQDHHQQQQLSVEYLIRQRLAAMEQQQLQNTTNNGSGRRRSSTIEGSSSSSSSKYLQVLQHLQQQQQKFDATKRMAASGIGGGSGVPISYLPISMLLSEQDHEVLVLSKEDLAKATMAIRAEATASLEAAAVAMDEAVLATTTGTGTATTVDNTTIGGSLSSNSDRSSSSSSISSSSLRSSSLSSSSSFVPKGNNKKMKNKKKKNYSQLGSRKEITTKKKKQQQQQQLRRPSPSSSSLQFKENHTEQRRGGENTSRSDYESDDYPSSSFKNGGRKNQQQEREGGISGSERRHHRRLRDNMDGGGDVIPALKSEDPKTRYKKRRAESSQMVDDENVFKTKKKPKKRRSSSPPRSEDYAPTTKVQHDDGNIGIYNRSGSQRSISPKQRREIDHKTNASTKNRVPDSAIGTDRMWKDASKSTSGAGTIPISSRVTVDGSQSPTRTVGPVPPYHPPMPHANQPPNHGSPSRLAEGGYPHQHLHNPDQYFHQHHHQYHQRIVDRQQYGMGGPFQHHLNHPGREQPYYSHRQYLPPPPPQLQQQQQLLFPQRHNHPPNPHGPYGALPLGHHTGPHGVPTPSDGDSHGHPDANGGGVPIRIGPHGPERPYPIGYLPAADHSPTIHGRASLPPPAPAGYRPQPQPQPSYHPIEQNDPVRGGQEQASPRIGSNAPLHLNEGNVRGGKVETATAEVQSIRVIRQQESSYSQSIRPKPVHRGSSIQKTSVAMSTSSSGDPPTETMTYDKSDTVPPAGQQQKEEDEQQQQSHLTVTPAAVRGIRHNHTMPTSSRELPSSFVPTENTVIMGAPETAYVANEAPGNRRLVDTILEQIPKYVQLPKRMSHQCDADYEAIIRQHKVRFVNRTVREINLRNPIAGFVRCTDQQWHEISEREACVTVKKLFSLGYHRYCAAQSKGRVLYNKQEKESAAISKLSTVTKTTTAGATASRTDDVDGARHRAKTTGGSNEMLDGSTHDPITDHREVQAVGGKPIHSRGGGEDGLRQPQQQNDSILEMPVDIVPTTYTPYRIVRNDKQDTKNRSHPTTTTTTTTTTEATKESTWNDMDWTPPVYKAKATTAKMDELHHDRQHQHPDRVKSTAVGILEEAVKDKETTIRPSSTDDVDDVAGSSTAKAAVIAKAATTTNSNNSSNNNSEPIVHDEDVHDEDDGSVVNDDDDDDSDDGLVI